MGKNKTNILNVKVFFILNALYITYVIKFAKTYCYNFD